MAVNRLPGGVYWALAALASDYTLEIPLRRLARELRLTGRLPQPTWVSVPVRRSRPLSHIVLASARIAAAGMWPIVPVSAGDLGDPGVADRTLGALADAGTREVTVFWPTGAPLVEILDDLVRVISRGDLRRRGLTGISAEGSLGWNVPRYSADLLRALDAAHASGRENAVRVTLLAPSVRAIEPVVEWERSLSAAGNRIPIRLRIPGPAENPAHRAIPMLLGLATAIDENPECLINGVQLMLRGSLARASVFASEVRKGNFVIENTGSGYQFSLLRAHRSKEGRSDD
jgi:hypothetical protein